MQLESKFQSDLISELLDEYPGAVILKNDASFLQGIPDRLILYGRYWAMLETKRWTNSSHQPNQEYYVDMLNSMSFARFINPENKERVLDELQSALRPRRRTRISLA
jgi:hypothetical protein